MKDLLQRGKAVVEGAGALATAALLAGKVDSYIKGKSSSGYIWWERRLTAHIKCM